uniref:Uncharacterized protein n=1 Tax=Oryza rufipogon TaxID=4529 RepID=A0A0E0PLV0_ORYRU
MNPAIPDCDDYDQKSRTHLSWLKLWLCPMVYKDAAYVDSKYSCAPVKTSSKEQTPTTHVLLHAERVLVVSVVSRSAT